MSTEIYSFDGQKYVSEAEYRKLEVELKAWESIPTLRGMRPIGTNDYILSLMKTSKYFEDSLAKQRRLNELEKKFLQTGLRRSR